MIAACAGAQPQADVRRGVVLRAEVRARPPARSRRAPSASIYFLRQCEKHSGPHSDWFYDLDQSGGGALMDMGCHGFAWFRWMLGRTQAAERVSPRCRRGLIHGARTRCEENSRLPSSSSKAASIGIVENSWAKLGGMEDRIEVCGTGGVVYADLFMGNSALTYSEKGYGYAMEKAGSTQGWTFTHVRGSLQSGLPAGAAALHRLRAERHAAASQPARTAAPCSSC